VQGPEVVAPWVNKYSVSFPVAVDTADVFGAAFGLKAIPVSFLVDEVGIIRLQGGGPSKEFRAQVEEILREPVSAVRGQSRETPTALSLHELRRRAARQPDDAAARLALAQGLDRAGDLATALAECEAAARLQPKDAMIPFTHGLVLLRQGQTNDALVKLAAARELDSANWRIRKQIWALEHPEKFYGTNGIDWNWQKEQIAREKR
jgi:tetratricopeptide (TPR) repeat protein